MDYLKPVSVRLTFEVVVIILLIGYVGWTIQVLWGAG
jgi:succinate dehydrogenase hydrophobic anchor subunit